MPITRLDHVNIVTVNLADMVAWYRDVPGLTEGARPSFRDPDGNHIHVDFPLEELDDDLKSKLQGRP